MTFEEAKHKTASAARMAGEKTEKLVCRQKVKFDLTVAKNELDALYRELGIACYNASSGCAEDAAAAAVREKIRGKINEISALKARIARLR